MGNDAWRDFFERWPADRPRTGIVVTRFQETIPFTRFLVAEGLIALERDRPDSLGARKVFLSLSSIDAVKMTDTEDFEGVRKFGFC